MPKTETGRVGAHGAVQHGQVFPPAHQVHTESAVPPPGSEIAHLGGLHW